MDRGRFEYPEDVYEEGERVPKYAALVWDRGPAGDFGKPLLLFSSSVLPPYLTSVWISQYMGSFRSWMNLNG